MITRVSACVVLSILALQGCDSGEIFLPEDVVVPNPKCELDSPPPAPEILTPTLGELKQPEDVIAIELAANASGEARLLDIEMWLLAGDGTPILKVWGAESTGDTLDLSSGQFELGFDALDSWKRYAVRARSREGGEFCDFGDWSNYQDFKIDDGSELYFDEDIIRDVEITLGQESYDLIDAEALPPDCVPYSRPYHPGTVTFDGVTYENAGVRVKGGCGSSRTLSEKASFKINLSDYSEGGPCPMTRRARGLKRITVNNQVQDPSHAHERLAYHFYDLLGIPVPRRAPIRVHVNGDLWGFYLHLESIDRRFFRRRYEASAAEGMVYEGTYFCNLTPDNKPALMGPETCFSQKFSDTCSTPDPNGDPFDYSPLRTFIDRIDSLTDQEYYTEIQKIVDFPTFLRQWSADAIMNHWDGAVFDILNNYRVYHNPFTDKWVIIPTGMDQSFNLNQRTVDPWQPGTVIATRCLRIQECEDAFAVALRETLNIFENADMVARTNAIRTQITADVLADPRQSSNNFESRIDRTITFIEGRRVFIENALSAHGY
ncbi:MAG: CotH kinase family protein [Kofleriaceae bacterium]|nr:CotH kinase family protein [Kofleriaceae bacterium]